MPVKKKKHPKMDKLLVAAKEKSLNEIKYISKRFKIPIGKVKIAAKLGGRSRAKVYEQLRMMGYVIKTRKYK